MGARLLLYKLNDDDVSFLGDPRLRAYDSPISRGLETMNLHYVFLWWRRWKTKDNAATVEPLYHVHVIALVQVLNDWDRASQILRCWEHKYFPFWIPSYTCLQPDRMFKISWQITQQIDKLCRDVYELYQIVFDESFRMSHPFGDSRPTVMEQPCVELNSKAGQRVQNFTLTTSPATSTACQLQV